MTLSDEESPLSGFRLKPIKKVLILLNANILVYHKCTPLKCLKLSFFLTSLITKTVPDDLGGVADPLPLLPRGEGDRLSLPEGLTEAST